MDLHRLFEDQDECLDPSAGKPDAPPVSPHPFRGAPVEQALYCVADEVMSWLWPKAGNPRCELLLGRSDERLGEATDVSEQSAGRQG